MSKAKVVRHSDQPKEPDIFMTPRGIAIELLPVSPYTLDDIGGSVSIPEQPKYEIHTNIVDETHLMDETCLDVPDDPAETLRRHKIWAEYLQAKHSADQELSNKLLNVIIAESVVLGNGDPSPEWIERRKRLFGNVPEDLMDLKSYYVLRELTRTPSEVEALITAVLRLSEIDEEKLRLAEETFQRALAGRVGSDTSGDKRDSSGS